MQRPDMSRGRFLEICTQRQLVKPISLLPCCDRSIAVTMDYVAYEFH